MQKFLVLCVLFIVFNHTTKAQSSYGGGDPTLESKGFRNFIGNFSVHASTGFGLTFYSHEINGPGILQKIDGSVYLFDNTFVIGDSLNTGYINWVNSAQALGPVPIGDEDFLLHTDTAIVKYKGSSFNIPLSISVSYTFDRYRFGGGYSYEQALSPNYYPNIEPKNLNHFRPNYLTTSITRYYGYFGGDIYRSYRHTIAVDAKIGTYKFGTKNFNATQITTKLFFNLGISFERSLSEYFKVYVRPSGELKNYSLMVPDLTYTINHSMPAFYVNVGAVMRMPDLRKCKVDKCKTQRNHRHGAKLYRSKVHPFWKWQNPNYGQNYPSLIKYKGNNKRKLNPY